MERVEEMNDCKRCNAADREILKLKQEIVRLKSRLKTMKKKVERYESNEYKWRG